MKNVSYNRGIIKRKTSMAYIDKTYLNSWEQYVTLKDWCTSIGTTVDDYGNKITPLEFLWEYTEKDFTHVDDTPFNGLPVWNTPEYFDVWLIRKCPLNFIQDRLKEQYGEGWSKTSLTGRQSESQYQLIKEHRAQCDLYKRNGLGKNAVMKIKWNYNYRFNDDNLVWWIDILHTDDSDSWWYNRDEDKWLNTGKGELGEWNSNTCIKKGRFSLKKVLRLIRKWNLPEGTRVRFSIEYKRYVQKDFIVTVCKPKIKNKK